MRWPRRKSFRLTDRASWSIRVDRRRGLGAALARLPNDGHRLRRTVGDGDQLQVRGGDLSLARHAVPQPVHETLPVGPAEQAHGEMLHLAELDQGERLEQLVHRAVAAAEDNE